MHWENAFEELSFSRMSRIFTCHIQAGWSNDQKYFFDPFNPSNLFWPLGLILFFFCIVFCWPSRLRWFRESEVATTGYNHKDEEVKNCCTKRISDLGLKGITKDDQEIKKIESK